MFNMCSGHVLVHTLQRLPPMPGLLAFPGRHGPHGLPVRARLPVHQPDLPFHMQDLPGRHVELRGLPGLHALLVRQGKLLRGGCVTRRVHRLRPGLHLRPRSRNLHALSSGTVCRRLRTQRLLLLHPWKVRIPGRVRLHSLPKRDIFDGSHERTRVHGMRNRDLLAQ